jgi:DNA-binding CsgD family transcriptional regulator
VGLASSLSQPGEVAIDEAVLEHLSQREKQVLAELLAGSRVPAIAKCLHISPHTVRNHLKSMYRKLGVGTQSELIERVRSSGAAD